MTSRGVCTAIEILGKHRDSQHAIAGIMNADAYSGPRCRHARRGISRCAGLAKRARPPCDDLGGQAAIRLTSESANRSPG